jgi:hypothetical protein
MVAYISQKMTYFSERLFSGQVLVLFDRSDVTPGVKACTTKVEKWKWHRPGEVVFNSRNRLFFIFRGLKIRWTFYLKTDQKPQKDGLLEDFGYFDAGALLDFLFLSKKGPKK